MTSKIVFLIGYMGSGKSTTGRRLARRLGWTFVDLDQEIVKSIGMSIPDYFSQYGESAFRTIERDALRALDLNTPAVVATGGGTPCYHANMDWMNAHGKTIYLRLSSKVLWQRLSRTDVSLRPVLKGLEGEELLQFIESKLADRHPFYQQAQVVVDPLRDKVNDIVDKLNIDSI